MAVHRTPSKSASFPKSHPLNPKVSPRVEGPIWIHVELPHGQQVRYPIRTIPWEFGCDAFEVRKDGKLLDPIPVPTLPRAYSFSGLDLPSCIPSLGIAINATNRLPLHLQYDFTEPGTYEVRLSHYGDFMRKPSDIRAQSPWTKIEVLEASPRLPVPSPEFPEPIISFNFFPISWPFAMTETLWTLLGNLYNGTSVVRAYAADALYYWPDSVIIPQLLQSLRSYGPVPEAIERLGYPRARHARSGAAVPHGRQPRAHEGRAPWWPAARWTKTAGSQPEVRARVEQTLIAVAANAQNMDPGSGGELISVIGRIKTPQVPRFALVAGRSATSRQALPWPPSPCRRIPGIHRVSLPI